MVRVATESRVILVAMRAECTWSVVHIHVAMRAEYDPCSYESRV